MRKVWYVATYEYEGMDGEKYYCASAVGRELYTPIAIKDRDLCDLRAAETKRDAERIAHHQNELYREQGNLATANRSYKV